MGSFLLIFIPIHLGHLFLLSLKCSDLCYFSSEVLSSVLKSHPILFSFNPNFSTHLCGSSYFFQF